MTSSSERRSRFLTEMGIGPLWTLRKEPENTSPENPSSVAEESTAAPAETQIRREPAPQEVPVSFDDEPPAWDLPPLDLSELPEAFPEAGTAPPADAIAQMGWTELESMVAGCVKCGLCQTRTNTVFGVGDRKARWLFIGEGPGRNEDLRGEPFIGAAGKLLDNMLLAMGLKRGENAYIANIVKCRPTDANGRDRPPTPEESAACMPYLERQIALIQPSVIVALGKTAALSLLGADPDTPVSKLRGVVHRRGNIPLVVTYHPAYLLRKLEDKGKAWRDLCLAMTTYAGQLPRD